MIQLNSYSIFSDSKSTLKEASKDDSNVFAPQYMTQSSLEVIDFDLVKRKYANKLGLSEENASSVDAIIQFENHLAFIEFKNGKVNNRNIKDKIRDSLLIFSDIIGESISYTREHAELIIVYNLEKNPLPNQLTKDTPAESPSRIKIADYFSSKAEKEFILFDLERYEKLYFQKVHTYPKEKFEEYLKTIS